MRFQGTPRKAADAAREARRLALRALRRPRRLDDPYIEWLTLAVAGMQHPGNPYLFDLAIASAPRAPMLEIGSFCGLSASIIQYLKVLHGRGEEPLYCCDSWVFEGSGRPLPAAAPVTHAQLRAHVMEEFRRTMLTFSPQELPFAIEMASDELLAAWDAGERVSDVFGRTVTLGGPLGFCFIDGGHSEEQARRDFEGCDRHLLRGGVILFDDSGDDTDWEVRRVVREVRRGGRYELLARNPNYLLRKLR